MENNELINFWVFMGYCKERNRTETFMKEWLKNTYKTFTGSIQEFKEKADSVLADYIKENPSHGKVSISEVIVHGHFLDGYPCGWHFSIEVKGRRQNPGLWATLQKRPEEQSSNED